MVKYLGSDSIGNKTQVSVSNNDTIFLAKGVSVIAGAGTDNTAFGFKGNDVSGVDIVVLGDIWGNNGAINLLNVNDDLETSNNITIGKSGSLFSTLGPVIHIEGDSSSVTNTGEISGTGQNAVQLWGNFSVVLNSGLINLMSDKSNAVGLYGFNTKIINSGTIQGSGYSAVILFSELGKAPIVDEVFSGSLDNTGTILSTGFAVQGSAGSDLFSNTGTILGDIKLGGGAGGDSLSNSGLIEGRVDGFGSGGGIVKNSGTITEELILGGGFDLVINTGELNYVDLGRSNDRYIGLGDGYVPSRVDGGTGNDRLTGGKFADVFNGDQGGDTLRGKGGEDTLTGGAGNDLLFGGEAADDLDGGSGKDRLWGNRGNDVLVGGSQDDKLYGNADEDTLKGGIGEDTLWGGRGDDDLYGGAGADRFVFKGDSGNDGIYDFTRGSDLIVLQNLGVEGFADLSNALTIAGTGAVIDLSEFGNDARIYVANVETLTSADFLFT